MEELPEGCFKKETILLEDGRYLIYYDFTPEQSGEKPVQSSAGKDEK